MKKLLFAIAILIMMFSCSSHVNINEIKQGIIEVETQRLPLTIQKCDNVNDIRIDSIVIINNVEPYSGYLVTTWVIEKEQNDWDNWDYDWDNWDSPEGYRKKQETKTVYVEVDNIKTDLKGYSWETNWFGAYINTRY